MAGSTRVWWDRDLDHGGRPIRPDVRSAGHQIWEQACRRTRAVVSDQAPAAELLENAVAQVSRYLDRIGAPVSPGKHGLLMAAFSRSLERYASKSARIELAGASTELQNRIPDESWVARSNARLDLETILRRLSGRNAQVLMLRAAAYEWKEIAELFGTSAARVRNSFWREIKKIRGDCALRTVCVSGIYCGRDSSSGYVQASRNSER